MKRFGFRFIGCGEHDEPHQCKSLHRMLSPKGNPSMDNLAAIFGAMRTRLKLGLEVWTVELA